MTDQEKTITATCRLSLTDAFNQASLVAVVTQP